jgi:hypothetical protein
MVPFIIQGNNIVVFSGGVPTTVDSSHLNYAKLLDALKAQDWDAIPGLLTVKKAIETFSFGSVTFDGETVMFKGKPMQNALSTRMIKMFKDGFPITHLIKFMDRLAANPSYRAVTELYGFLDANSLPITDDGCFLAYKRIREDYTDCHTGTMDNSVGQVVEMPRNEVNDDKDQTCSAGLHFCGYTYLSSFGGARLVVVKIDPADVVSIPSDYNNQKGRTCKFTVVEEILVPETAVKDDCLGAGPAVVTGFEKSSWPQPAKKAGAGSVESVFAMLDADEVENLIEELNSSAGQRLDLEFDDHSELTDLLNAFSFKEIRAAMRELGYL